MIPSLNALKVALRHLLLDRVDVHTAISTLEITDPENTELITLLKENQHDLWQVCEMLADMIKQREETMLENKESDGTTTI